MQVLRQAAAVTAMSFLSIRQRIGASLVIVMGMAVVVGVLIAMQSATASFLQAMEHTGHPDRALVVTHNVRGLGPNLARADALTIMDAPGIKRGSNAQAIASADAIMPLQGVVKTAKGPAAALVWGMGPQMLALRPEIKLISGRMFQPGLYEIIVGRAAQARYRGVEVGARLSIYGRQWVIVGAFDSGRNLPESGFIGDAETIQAAFRMNQATNVTVQLENAEAFDVLKEALTTNPSLSVDVHHERDFYYAIFKQLDDVLSMLAYGLSAVMGLGAIFGALNTMYSAVAARKVEIATLRAMGFGGSVLVVSIFAEVLTLALVGALLGSVVAWTSLSGRMFTQSIIVFDLSVTPAQVAIGIVWALAIGAIGALFPAIRAARLPVATALQVR